MALWPLAAMESHGPHLPVGTDALIADGIVDRATALDTSKRLALRLPTLWLGASSEHADVAGTLSREPEALIADIVAGGEGLARAGVRKMILFNAHGGNIAAAAIAALKLRTRFGILVASVHWLDFGLPPAFVPPTPIADDVHGGWIETSIILYLAPHLVDRTRAVSAPATTPAPSLFPRGPIAWGWKTADLAPHGYVGRPDLAKPDIGRALVDHAAQSLNALTAEIAAATWTTGA